MLERLKNWFNRLTLPNILDDYWLALVLFLINLFLVYAIFFPIMSDINPWDEAVFVHSGQELVEGGEIPKLSGNPLTSLFLGITYFPFRNSTFWMLKSISLARILLFCLIWWSTYLVAKELRDLSPPIIPLGILFVTPLSIEMLRFPTDPLFASFSAFSLWQLLRYKQTNERRNLANASFFMALAALARVDGLVQFAILFFLGLVIEKLGGVFRIDPKTLTSLILLGTLKNYGLAGGLALALFNKWTAVPATVSVIFMIVYIIWLGFKRR